MIDVRLLRKYLRAKRKLERKLDEINRKLKQIGFHPGEDDQVTADQH